MAPTSTASATSAQLKSLSSIVAADPTIPAAHKNVLQTIFSFLLNLAPFILEAFLGDDGDVPEDLVGPLSTVTEAPLSQLAPRALIDHPVTASLASAMSTAVAGATPENKGVLDKIFAFVLKILPTILGLFSHGSTASAPAAASAAGGGDGGTTGSGQAPGTGANAGGVPLDGGDGSASAGAVVGASSN